MRCEELFQIAFESGCGQSLREVLGSEEYARLLAEEISNFEQYDARQRFFFQAGPFVLSGKINQIVAGKETGRSRIRLNRYPNTEQIQAERALLRLLGRKILEVGFSKWPDYAKDLASRFRDSEDFGKKQDLIIELVEFFNKNNYFLQNPPAADLEDNDSVARSLPFQFPTIGTGQLPSCLGVAIMLAGWAKKAGAHTLLANLIRTEHAVENRFDLVLTEQIIAALRSKTIFLERRIHKQLYINHQIAQVEARAGFHTTPAIEIEKDIWLYVDLYLRYYAFLEPSWWEIHAIDHVLDMIQGSQPGINVTVDTTENKAEELEEVINKSLEIMGLASSMEKKIFSRHMSTRAFRQFLQRSREWRAISGLNQTGDGHHTRHKAQMQYILGLGKTRKARNETMKKRWQKFEENQRFQRNCKKRLLSLFYLVSLDYYYDWLGNNHKENGRLPAVLEFGNTEFNLALQLLNNIYCQSEVEDKEIAEFMFAHSSSQVIWYHHFQGYFHSRESKALCRDSLKMLSGMEPSLHRFCKDAYTQLRSKGDHHGRT